MPATISVPGRVDICSFATLVRGYIEAGLFLRSKSDVLWQAVEELSRVVEKRGTARFTDVADAVAYLDSVHLSLKTSERAVRSIMSAEQQQVAAEDFGLGRFEGPLSTKKQKLEDDLDELRRMYTTVAEQMKQAGMPTITFEEYVKRMKAIRREDKKLTAATRPINAASYEVDPTEVIQETVSQGDFQKKEEERLRAEKSAYSPDALRAAFGK